MPTPVTDVPCPDCGAEVGRTCRGHEDQPAFRSHTCYDRKAISRFLRNFKSVIQVHCPACLAKIGEPCIASPKNRRFHYPTGVAAFPHVSRMKLAATVHEAQWGPPGPERGALPLLLTLQAKAHRKQP
jgi:hypothetical protein